MFTVTLIISLVAGGVAFISFLINLRTPTKMRKRIIYGLAVISLLAAIASGVLSYRAGVETDEQLKLAHGQALEASEQADRAQEQITEIRMPRRMEPETKRMLVTRLKPYAGQKYDMQVFRDEDSLELASTIQGILKKAGWVETNVCPKQHAARYAETGGNGLFIVSGTVRTTRTSEVGKALRGALTEAGLYNDSSEIVPVKCVEIPSALPQVGDKATPIPCSDSPIQSMEIFFTNHDDVIPEDTLVIHVGEKRL